jgi:hypothetical protein
MRAALLLPSLLLAGPAMAVDFSVGADVDVAFAYGTTLKGPGGGVGLHVGLGPNPIKLGPSALSLTFEVAPSFWRFPDATDGATDLVRGTAGVRGIFTVLWLRAPADDGGRGRGIRLDVPVVLHGGVGSLDEGATLTPTGDASVGFAVGLMPVELGVHVGVGALAASQSVDSLDGTAWLNVGVDVGFVF